MSSVHGSSVLTVIIIVVACFVFLIDFDDLFDDDELQ